MTAAPGRSAF